MNARVSRSLSMRPMTVADIGDVMAMEVRAYPFPWTAGIFSDCLRSGYACWLLEEQGGLLGYGVLSVAAGEAHLLNLCIGTQAQGQGLGAHLLRKMIELARWHHAQRVFLEVRPSNPAALALYERAGFNEIGRRPNYYPTRGGREDALVLALELLPEEPDDGPAATPT